MPQNKHKYRVNVYLGKANYERLDKMAQLFNIPLPSMVKLMIDTGMSIGDALATEAEVDLYGNK